MKFEIKALMKLSLYINIIVCGYGEKMQRWSINILISMVSCIDFNTLDHNQIQIQIRIEFTFQSSWWSTDNCMLHKLQKPPLVQPPGSPFSTWKQYCFPRHFYPQHFLIHLLLLFHHPPPFLLWVLPFHVLEILRLVVQLDLAPLWSLCFWALWYEDYHAKT